MDEQGLSGSIGDRSAATVAAHIKKIGLEPVWKDWEGSILN